MSYTKEIKEEIVSLAKEAMSGRQIASYLGLSKSGVNAFLSQYYMYKSKPRILFLDVETAPSVVVAFDRYDVTITPSHVLNEGGWIISASWSWYGENEVHGFYDRTDVMAQRDFDVTQRIVEEIEKADLVVAHNGDRFDIPIIKTRALQNKIVIRKSIKTVDTLKIAKRLKFNSNKLDSLGNYLGVGRKIPTTGITLWIQCMKGDFKALDTMLKYNKQDVQLLKDVFDEIRAYDSSAINFGMFFDDEHEHCPSCGSPHLSETGNVVRTGTGKFTELSCDDCGRISRRKQMLNTKTQRAKLLAKA
jgi:transposase-like protein